jgi:hypothetical protein
VLVRKQKGLAASDLTPQTYASLPGQSSYLPSVSLRATRVLFAPLLVFMFRSFSFLFNVTRSNFLKKLITVKVSEIPHFF